MSQRHKAKILQIGTVDENDVAHDWCFAGEGKGAAHEITDGVVYIGGYTIEELRETARRHQEAVEGMKAVFD